MKLTFLGTASIPTSDRNPHSFLLEFKEQSVLVECGEGVQLQLLKLNYDTSLIKQIYITHEHVDHIIGVLGVIMTSYKNKQFVEVLGPKSVIDMTEKLVTQLGYFAKDYVTYRVLKHGDVVETSSYSCYCFSTFHTKDSLAYRFENEQSIVFSGDLEIQNDTTLESLVCGFKQADFAIIDGVHINEDHLIKLIQNAQCKENYILPIRLDTTADILIQTMNKNNIHCHVPNDFDVINTQDKSN